MSVHLPTGSLGDEKTWRCRDHIYVSQDYQFMGHIIDMSSHRVDDECIPEKPLINLCEMDGEDSVTLTINDHSDYYIPHQNFYICRAGEFAKIPDTIKSTQKNKAILSLLKLLDPLSWVIIKMSW